MATDVSAPLPDLLLAPGATITVTLDDPAARITQLNVYGYSPERSGDGIVELSYIPPMFPYAPDA